MFRTLNSRNKYHHHCALPFYVSQGISSISELENIFHIQLVFRLVKVYNCNLIFFCITFFSWWSPACNGDDDGILLLVVVIPRATRDKQLVTAVHTLHQSENPSLDNSLSIKLKINEVTFQKAPKIFLLDFSLLLVINRQQLFCTLALVDRYCHFKLILILNTRAELKEGTFRKIKRVDPHVSFHSYRWIVLTAIFIVCLFSFSLPHIFTCSKILIIEDIALKCVNRSS